MRQIDADALKDNMFHYAAPEMVWDRGDIEHKIDEQPTIDAIPVEWLSNEAKLLTQSEDGFNKYVGEVLIIAVKYWNMKKLYTISLSAFCKNCAYYEIEWQYCFKAGCHAPETGYCGGYKEKVEPKEDV